MLNGTIKDKIVDSGWMLQLSAMGMFTDVLLQMMFPDKLFSSEVVGTDGKLSVATMPFRNHQCSLLRKCREIAEFFCRDAFCCHFCEGYHNGRDNSQALKILDRNMSLALNDEKLYRTISSIKGGVITERKFRENPALIVISNLIRSMTREVRRDTYYLIRNGKRYPPPESIYVYKKVTGLVFSQIVSEKQAEDDLLLLRKEKEGFLAPIDFRNGQIIRNNGNCQQTLLETIKKIINPSGNVVCNDEDRYCRGFNIGGIVIPIDLSLNHYNKALEFLGRKFDKIPIAMIGLTDEISIHVDESKPTPIPTSDLEKEGGAGEQPKISEERLLIESYIKDAFNKVMSDVPPITDGSGQNFKLYFEGEEEGFCLSNLHQDQALIIAEEVFRTSGLPLRVMIVNEDGTDSPLPAEEPAVIPPEPEEQTGPSETPLDVKSGIGTVIKIEEAPTLEQPGLSGGSVAASLDEADRSEELLPPRKELVIEEGGSAAKSEDDAADVSRDDVQSSPSEGIHIVWRVLIPRSHKLYLKLETVMNGEVLGVGSAVERDVADKVDNKFSQPFSRYKRNDFLFSVRGEDALKVENVYAPTADMMAFELTRILRSDVIVSRVYSGNKQKVNKTFYREQLEAFLVVPKGEEPKRQSVSYLTRRDMTKERWVISGFNFLVLNGSILKDIEEGLLIGTVEQVLIDARSYDEAARLSESRKHKDKLYTLRYDGVEWLELEAHEDTAMFVTQQLIKRLKAHFRLYQAFPSTDIYIKLPLESLVIPASPVNPGGTPIPPEKTEPAAVVQLGNVGSGSLANTAEVISLLSGGLTGTKYTGGYVIVKDDKKVGCNGDIEELRKRVQEIEGEDGRGSAQVFLRFTITIPITI